MTTLPSRDSGRLLAGHRAIVTGGGSGIGAATARRMADEGAQVAIFDVDGEAAKTVAAEAGGTGYAVEVTDAGAVERAVQEAASAMGGLSIMFNNAGTGSFGSIHGMSPDEWERVLRVNLWGVYHGIRAAAPIMLEGGDGRIVNTASISGTRPAAGEAPYSASKAAIVALTCSAALEYAPAIRVNAVSPGLIHTTLTDPMRQGMPEHWQHIVATTPAARAGEPADIADVVVFLSSDLARFVTGQNIVVDGGLILHTSGVDGIFDRIKDLL